MSDSLAFRNRLARNARHWTRWARKQGIDCFRIYDRDIPQFPLAIDRYGDHVHLQEIDTGWQQTDDAHEAWTNDIALVVGDVLELDTGHIHFKRRERQRGRTQYGKFAQAKHSFVVGEAGLRFAVDLDSYLDTGLFIDHRKTRSLVRELAAGKRFLNLFCYTGSFTVHAAAGGAANSESVDLSNTYLDWAGRNLRLNALDSPRHRLIHDDVFAYLEGALRSRKQFDLIVLDPPSFSNSRRMHEVLDVTADHPRLIERCMRLLAPGGELIFSTNRRQFEIDPAVIAQHYCNDIHHWSVPDDFRNRTAHRCWRISHR